MPNLGVGRRRVFGIRFVVLALAVFGLVPEAVQAESGAEEVVGSLQWSIYSGRWAIGKTGEASELGFELRHPVGTRGFDLVGGLAATSDEAVWGYAGASWSWEPRDKWRVRPGFAVSLFDGGDGKDLGGPLEFRSSFEATYKIRGNVRLGLLAYHLSNAGIYDLNPGSNSLVLVVDLSGR